MKSWQSVLAAIERTVTSRGRRSQGRFSIEGIRLVERALRAGAAIESALVGPSFARANSERARRLLDQLARRNVETHVAPHDVLARLTGGRRLGAIVALVRLPEPTTLARALRASPLEPPVLLAALGVSDPGNTGALVRTAHAIGAAALLTLPPTDPWHPRAVRTSMGSVFKLPVVAHTRTESLLDDLGAAGVRSLVAVPSGGSPIEDCQLARGPWCVLLGAEAHGVPPSVLERVERRVSLPMVDGIDSLSANAAAAVLLYALASPRLARARRLP